MADRETELIARLAPGVAQARRSALGQARRRSDPFLSHAFLSALENSGSVGPRHRLVAGADHHRGRRRRLGRSRAGLSQEPQPGRICVRSRLGRRLRARRRAILSQAPDRGAVHSGSRGRGCSAISRSNCSPRPRRSPLQNGLSSAHITFLDEAGAAECERARLADPRRHPVSLAQSRLWRFRRLPRRADQPQAQGHPQGARSGSRGSRIRRAQRQRDRRGGVGRDVGVLPGHRQPQMGPALSDPLILRPDRRDDGATGCCCSSLIATAGRLPARSTSSVPTRSTAAIGGRSTRCRSCTSSYPIIRRSNGRSRIAWPRSRRARKASTSWPAAMNR